MGVWIIPGTGNLLLFMVSNVVIAQFFRGFCGCVHPQYGQLHRYYSPKLRSGVSGDQELCLVDRQGRKQLKFFPFLGAEDSCSPRTTT